MIDRPAVVCAQDEGYDASFRPLGAAIMAGFLADHDPGRQQGWIAVGDYTRLSCIFVLHEAGAHETGDTAKLRLFLPEPEARCTGLGHRMLQAALDFARSCGSQTMRL